MFIFVMSNKTIFLTPQAENVWELEFNQKNRNFSNWIQEKLNEIGEERTKITIEEADKNIKNLDLEVERIKNEKEFWINRKIVLNAEKKKEKKEIRETKEEAIDSLLNQYDIDKESASSLAEEFVKEDGRFKLFEEAEKRGFKLK